MRKNPKTVDTVHTHTHTPNLLRKVLNIKTFIVLLIVMIVISMFYQQYLIYITKNKIDILSNRIYNIEQTNKNRTYAHMSIDDTINIFKDLHQHENSYNSIFENRMLNYFKELHIEYGIKISCYCWYEDASFNLSLLSDKYAKEFQENKDWLRFGFHAYDRNVIYSNDGDAEKLLQDYNKTVNELIRITGGKDTIDNVIRLHYYSGNKKCIDNIKNTENGIIGLLTADTEGRNSYYLSEEENQYLFNNDEYELDNLIFFNTDFRMENYEDLQNVLEQYKENNPQKTTTLEFFTHEWIINDKNIRDNIEACCNYVVNNNYSWDFEENRIHTK